MKFIKSVKHIGSLVLQTIKEDSINIYSFILNLFKKVFSLVYNLFKKLPKAYSRVLALALSFVMVWGILSSVFAATGVISAYNVFVENKKIGAVKDKTVLAEAEILTATVLSNSKCNSLVSDAKLVHGLSTEGKLLSAEELSMRIVDASSKITKYAVLSINGIAVAGSETEVEVNSVLENYLKNYKLEGDMEGVEYSKSLSVMTKYIPLDEANSLEKTENYVLNKTLPVESYKKVVKTESISYGTEKTKSSELLVGSTKTLSAGEKGEKEVTYKVFYKNGTETSKTEISSVVTKKPVAKKVLVGTKQVAAADKNGDVPMCWPVKRVQKSYVSSYMGDGRGHKGMDIVAPKGTPIYAGYKGEVVFSGRDSSGYGNYIIIDHKNGYKTLYAHCSELFAKVGDIVATGEHIAAVGTTGYSTGNHLHFEVRKNGVPVNPARFIGSK